MANLIGGHYRSNGIKQFPARVVLSLNGSGLGGDETHPEALTIFRSTKIFPDGEAPPDFHTFDPESTGITWDQYGEYWYKGRTEGGSNLKAVWDKNPSHFYQIQNEQGGNDPWSLQRAVDIERAISRAAAKDGVKCCIMNLAGGSPGDFELWKDIIAPFIVEAWEEGGHIYGRHLYGGDLVDENGTLLPGQPTRIIQELEYLKVLGYGGGVALTEAGLDGGYGVAGFDRFYHQITHFEQALRPYADMFIGFCWWECGNSEFDADYTNHLKEIRAYIEQSPQLPKWEPPEITPPPPPVEKHTAVVVKVPQTITVGKIIEVVGLTYVNRHTIAYSHDDMMTILRGGNSSSYVKVADPAEDGESITLIEEAGYGWEPLFKEEPAPEPITLKRGALGVDVSAYQGEFDWETAFENGVEYAIIRCSDGMLTSADSPRLDNNGQDVQFWHNAEIAHKSGKPWAIYHHTRSENIEAQAHKIHWTLKELEARGMPTRTANFEDGRVLPAAFADAELLTLSSNDIKMIYDILSPHYETGIYTSMYYWGEISRGSPIWWYNVFCWAADYGPNNGTLPNRAPYFPRGFDTVNIWQFSSQGGHLVGWESNSLDVNSAGPYVAESTPPPPPPPSGETIDLASYQIAHPNAWRVVKHVDEHGKEHGIDIQDMNLGNGRMVMRKNTQGEWYRFEGGFRLRERDTSPGGDRLYVMTQNGKEGGRVNPAVIELDKDWRDTEDHHVQYYTMSNCSPSGLSSGNVRSWCRATRQPNVTFNTYGQNLTFDEVVFLETTNDELQMYGVYQGVKVGWIGWTSPWGNAEPIEIHFDRGVLTQEPERYC